MQNIVTFLYIILLMYLAEIIYWQIEKGQADVDERDTTGATPAHFAAAQGKINHHWQLALMLFYSDV